MVECYDPVYRNGFILAETGERRGFGLCGKTFRGSPRQVSWSCSTAYSTGEA